MAWSVPTMVIASAAPAVASSGAPPAEQQLPQPVVPQIQGHNGGDDGQGRGPLFYIGINPPASDSPDNTGTYRTNFIDPGKPARVTIHFSFADGGPPATVTGGQSAYGANVVNYGIDAQGNAYVDLTPELIAKVNAADGVVDYTMLFLSVDSNFGDGTRPQQVYLTFSYTDTLYGYQDVTGNTQTGPVT